MGLLQRTLGRVVKIGEPVDPDDESARELDPFALKVDDAEEEKAAEEFDAALTAKDDGDVEDPPGDDELP